MLGPILVIVGAALMILGVFMLASWVSGSSRLFDSGVYDRKGDSKIDRQFLDLYFLAIVIAPLLGGAIMIAFGLRIIWH